MNFKKLSVFGFASALMLTVASCANDNMLPEPDGVLEADQTFYMNISVNGSYDMTRSSGALGDYTAEDTYKPDEDPHFSAGTGTENDVNSIYLLFFDANGNRLKHVTVVNDVNNTGAVQPGTAANPADPSINKIYSGVVQVAANKGELIPSYVIAFVNPISASFEGDEFSTINKVEQTLRADLIKTVNNHDFFAMSNSVYYGNDPVSGMNNVRIVATPIMANQIFTTAQKAQAAIDARNEGTSTSPTVDIYVERYAAKVNFQLGETSGDNNIIKGIKVANSDNSGEEYTLTFVPEAWAVNAVEPQTYVTKNFFKADGETVDFSQPADFSFFQNVFEGWSGWNSPDKHRSYWGQSHAYYEAHYPRTADDLAKDKNVDGTYDTYSLKYYSYNEIFNEAAALKGNKSFAKNVAANGTSTLYARENTVQGQALINAYKFTTGPASAIASVVMIGHYVVTDAQGQTVALPTGDDCFYVTGNSDHYTYYTKANMTKYFMEQAINFYYKNTADGDTEEEYLPVYNGTFAQGYADAFVLTHPNLNVLQNMALDSRFTTLQVDLSKLGDHKLYADLNGEIVEVTAANVDVVNRLLFSAVGTTRAFNNGKAYFNIPVKHLGFYRTGNENAGLMPTDEGWNWENVKSGDFGLVRNHVYTINVTKIEGLGNAIPNPNEPIVPPNDEDYYIGARIIVLNWALVPTQDVTL
ncbi:MAG: Mfa1 fimbrilin C-terminal domain-containing protein [Muribaculaceae bacterium]|nr:Mfa1 fimbrilin C-terminal domain-containing protein [Muribaculaceae bacterium]